MKKLIALAALVLMLGGANSALAAKDDNNGKAGPNGNNDHGLCTAYFNGQKKGHDDGSPGPFAALEEASEPEDDDGEEGLSAEEVAAAVYEYCQGAGIGGNEDHGRWACELTTQDDPTTEEDETDYTCTANEAPGNSGK